MNSRGMLLALEDILSLIRTHRGGVCVHKTKRWNDLENRTIFDFQTNHVSRELRSYDGHRKEVMVLNGGLWLLWRHHKSLNVAEDPQILKRGSGSMIYTMIKS